MKICDLRGIFKTAKLTIESIENPYQDYYLIKLKIPDNLNWQAGEHGVFSLDKRQKFGQNWRAFSIASDASEGYILIGTRIMQPISGYKRYLINMAKGDVIHLRGPYGWFKLQDETSPIILYASGVGITPIRSIMKYLENSHKRDVEVIYTAKNYFLFADELQKIAQANDKINLLMTQNHEDAKTQLIFQIDKYGNNAYYYISGAPSTLKALRKILKNKGISQQHIIDDSFTGLPI